MADNGRAGAAPPKNPDNFPPLPVEMAAPGRVTSNPRILAPRQCHVASKNVRFAAPVPRHLIHGGS
jgi:hypothetical protein